MGYPEMSVCVCKRGKTTGILTVRVQLSLRGLGHPGELPGGGDPGLLVLPFQAARPEIASAFQPKDKAAAFIL